MMNTEKYENNEKSAWCPGCTNFGLLQAVKIALAKLEIEPYKLAFVSGIGQAAKLPHYLKCNLFNGLHGRALPVATGVKAGKPDLTVIVTTGDGDCYGEGGNHFIHAIRRNPDITLLVHNNAVYALTKGQASPTTEYGIKTRLQFDGVTAEPFNPVAVSILMNCSFVARGYTGDLEFLSEIIKEAISYKGFSLVDIIQPCNTFGYHLAPYYKDKIYKLGNEYDPYDKEKALKLALSRDDKIPTGILFKCKRNLFSLNIQNIEKENLPILKKLINNFK